MQTLDEKILDQLVAVRAEIVQVEQAEPPLDVVVAARLAALEQAAARFRADPDNVGSDARFATPGAVRALVHGALMVLAPNEMRALIEAHTREVEQQRPMLRMTESDKRTKLAALRDKAKRIEARLEIQRRTMERDDPDVTFGRADYDPAIWLADDAELQVMAASNGSRAR